MKKVVPLLENVVDIVDNVQDILPKMSAARFPSLAASVDLALTTADRDLDKLTPETKLLAEEFLALTQSE